MEKLFEAHKALMEQSLLIFAYGPDEIVGDYEATACACCGEYTDDRDATLIHTPGCAKMALQKVLMDAGYTDAQYEAAKAASEER